MKIIIDIPEPFEEHFNQDRFNDSLKRISSDIRTSGFLSGLYELETLDMLREVMIKAEVVKEGKIGTPIGMKEEEKEKKKMRYQKYLELKKEFEEAI